MNNYNLITHLADSLTEEQESLLGELSQIKRIDYKTRVDFIHAIFNKEKEEDILFCNNCDADIDKNDNMYCHSCCETLKSKVRELEANIENLEFEINNLVEK